MPITSDNPYAAPQVLPSEPPDSVWLRLIYRTGIGILVGLAVFGILQFTEASASIGRGYFLLALCPFVAASSTFTQSESAKKSGRTGIIAAVMLWLASVVVTSLVIHAFGLDPPRFRGQEEEAARGDLPRFLIWTTVYPVLIIGYSVIYCRKETVAADSEQ